MIDDDDVTGWAIFGSTGSSAAGAVLFLAILVTLAVAAHRNSEECGARVCPPGTSPKLTGHECLCVTRPEDR